MAAAAMTRQAADKLAKLSMSTGYSRIDAYKGWKACPFGCGTKVEGHAHPGETTPERGVRRAISDHVLTCKPAS